MCSFPCLAAVLLFFFYLSSLFTLSSAYSWQLDAAPQQCSNISISITGSDGQPPYRLLVVRFGPSPLPDGTEVRKIIDQPFTDNSTSLTLSLNYPAGSQFIAVVSDATGFATGGTSMVLSVPDSDDASCFDSSMSVSSLFDFFVEPNQFSQCQPSRIWWKGQAGVQGTPSFLGIVPGGLSFSIQEENITNVTGQGTGFSWTPPLPTGATFALVAGDDRGIGSGGSVPYTVVYGANNACLDDAGATPTTGNIPGEIKPTAPLSSTTSTSSPGNKNAGKVNNVAIAGVVFGCVITVLFVALLFLCLRRRNTKPRLLEDAAMDLTGDNLPIPHFQESNIILPFLTSDPGTFTPSETSSKRRFMADRPRHVPTNSSTSSSYATWYEESAGEGLEPTTLIIQHGDAGPSTTSLCVTTEREVIELPPAYANIRRSIHHLHRMMFSPTTQR